MTTLWADLPADLAGSEFVIYVSLLLFCILVNYNSQGKCLNQRFSRILSPRDRTSPESRTLSGWLNFTRPVGWSRRSFGNRTWQQIDIPAGTLSNRKKTRNTCLEMSQIFSPVKRDDVLFIKYKTSAQPFLSQKYLKIPMKDNSWNSWKTVQFTVKKILNYECYMLTVKKVRYFLD